MASSAPKGIPATDNIPPWMKPGPDGKTPHMSGKGKIVKGDDPDSSDGDDEDDDDADD